MAETICNDPALREQILAAFTSMGCPLDHAETLTDTAIKVHNAIEDAREQIVADLGGALNAPGTDTYDGNFLVLLVQLELMHLNIVLTSLREQIEGAAAPTVQ